MYVYIYNVYSKYTLNVNETPFSVRTHWSIDKTMPCVWRSPPVCRRSISLTIHCSHVKLRDDIDASKTMKNTWIVWFMLKLSTGIFLFDLTIYVLGILRVMYSVPRLIHASVSELGHLWLLAITYAVKRHLSGILFDLQTVIFSRNRIHLK